MVSRSISGVSGEFISTLAPDDGARTAVAAAAAVGAGVWAALAAVSVL